MAAPPPLPPALHLLWLRSRRGLWGAWPRPCLQRSLRGGAAPMRVPEVAGKEAAEGTAPTLTAAAVAVGATNKLSMPGWEEGALQPSHSLLP